VILLMFGVGLHFSLRDLMAVKQHRHSRRARADRASPPSWAGAWLRGWAGAHSQSILFGLSLSVASTVVLLRALESGRMLDSERGRIAVGWLIVEDLAMVLALVLVPALAGNDDGEGLGKVLLATSLKVGGFIALMLIVGRRVLPWVLERVADTGSRELFTLCVLACAMGVAFGAAELFGVSFALGAFFAGMLLNESPFGHKAAEDSLPLRDAFAVLFFVSVGMLFDPAS
jgi:CPA2 family monovalent cation:H+ antiporter-2